jgi:PAS domain S-box-containing protein
MPSTSTVSLSPTLQFCQSALDAAPDAIIIADHRGIVQYANAQASALFGYPHDEIIGMGIETLTPERFRVHHVAHRDQYFGDPHVRPMGVGRNLLGRRRDGTEFPVEISLSLLRSGDDPCVICIARDVTEHRKLEARVVERTRELEAATNEATQANAAKSRFLAAASHDLRQPLQTIWSLQAALTRAFKDSEYTPYLALLEEAVRNMDQMLSALIDINRLEQGSIHPVIRDFSLNDILPRLRSEFAYAASAKSLILDLEDTGELARSDSMLLPVVLRNLIGNAIKYTQRGAIRLRARTDDTQLFIDIMDTGPGIPPAHLRRLFDAYYQVDNPNRDQSRGVGLGLSIVQTICKLLGHTVTVESEVGKGSTFTVRLLRGVGIENATATPISLPIPAQAPPSGTVTVLHIEDDPGVARSMAMLLRLEGYEVVGAPTRDEALQQVTTHALRPDLIICDYNLPMGFTGDEVVAEIAVSLGLKPPTIMLTGDIADKHLRKAKLVADKILPKPVDIALLLSCMSSLLEQKAANGDSSATAG